MFGLPVTYNEPVFRPPSEGRSLILQVTLGCSWNRCAFCEMYTSKEYSIRSEKEVFREICGIAEIAPDTKRIFLADGDAFGLPTDYLLRLLESIKRHFPMVRRISSYALPRNINQKSVNELQSLREAGLKLIYVGIESGDDELLKRIRKGETAASTIKGLIRAKEAGMKSSVILINGLGGELLSHQHAVNSARVLNETQPEFFSTLVLMFPTGEERFRSCFGSDFVKLDQRGLFQEMKTMITHTKLKTSVFRSDHASNFLVLKGTLDRDREKVLGQIQDAIDTPDRVFLRPERYRGL